VLLDSQKSLKIGPILGFIELILASSLIILWFIDRTLASSSFERLLCWVY